MTPAKLGWDVGGGGTAVITVQAPTGNAATDTAAISAAIAAAVTAAPATVVLPVGQYALSGRLLISGPGVTIRGQGYGTVLKWSANDSNPGIESVGNDDVHISDMSIIGSRPAGDVTTLTSHHGILIGNANCCSVRRCRVDGWNGHGILFAGYDDRSPGLTWTQGVWDSWIEDNYVTGTNIGIMIFNDCRRVICSGNVTTKLVSVGIMTDDSHVVGGTEVARECVGIVVTGNQVSWTKGAGIAIAGTQESIVSDNYICDTGRYPTTPTSTYSPGISLQSVQNLIVCKRNIVSNNVVTRCSHYGIALTGCTDNIVRGNYVFNNSYDRASGGVANIYLLKSTISSVDYGSSRNVIEGNFVDDDSTTSTVGSQIQIADPACVGNVIRNNYTVGGGSATKVMDAGVQTVIEGNTGYLLPGTAYGTGVAATESGNGTLHKTLLKLTNVAITLTDQGAAGSGYLQIYGFAAGAIKLVGATIDITTATSGLADGYSVDCALGTAFAAADGTLTGTEANLVPSITAAVATNAIAHKGKSGATEESQASFDGMAGANTVKVYLNFASAADPVGNKTLTVSGTVRLHWINLGP